MTDGVTLFGSSGVANEEGGLFRREGLVGVKRNRVEYCQNNRQFPARFFGALGVLHIFVILYGHGQTPPHS
jgi:hypothetical protein